MSISASACQELSSETQEKIVLLLVLPQEKENTGDDWTQYKDIHKQGIDTKYLQQFPEK